MKKKKTFYNYFNTAPVVFFFAIMIIAFSFGYSLYFTSFAIDGGGYVRPYSDVRITNVSLNSSTNGGYLNEDMEFSTHSFYLNGTVPGALYTYGTLIADITITNLSSTGVYITSFNKDSFSNMYMTYELRNLTVNETYIPPASDYTFQVLICYNRDLISNILGLVGDVVSYLISQNLTNIMSQFTVGWSYLPNHNLTINTTEPDSLIVIEQNGEIIANGTGNFSGPVEENAVITWTVTKTGYLPQTGTVTMDGDKVINVTMQTANMYQLSIHPTPSDATVIISESGNELVHSTGNQTVSVYDGHTITYTVKKNGYNTETSSVVVNGGNQTINVTLQEATPFEGTFTNTDFTVPTVVTQEIYKDGYYLVELWGGAGGRGNLNLTTGLGGASGYVYGIVHLNYEDTIYVTLGGNGESTGSNLAATDISCVGGANGGGPSTGGGAGGGGYSAVGVNVSSINLTDLNDNKVLLIAGGAGGGGTRAITATAGSGGSGGNISTSATTIYDNGVIYNGFNGTTTVNCSNFPALGGTNVGGTNSGVPTGSGSLFTGGTGIYLGAGGGSGFYGGAGGGSQKATIINLYAGSGGGGGSSYVNQNVLSASSYISNLVGTNPSTTGGAAIITYLGQTI